MPQPARNVGVDDVVPMVIDQGQRGLEQSRHHPRAGQSAYNNTSNVGEAAGQRGSSASKSSLRDILVGRVILGKEEELETELKAWIPVSLGQPPTRGNHPTKKNRKYQQHHFLT